MSLRDDMRQEMYERLMTAQPTIPIDLDNSKFERPENAPWFAAYFKYIASKRASIGTTQRFTRHKGFFIVNAYVPEKSGTKQLWTMADSVIDTFNSRNFTLADGSAVTIGEPYTAGQPTQMDGFCYIPVMIPFIIDAVPEV